MADKDLKICVLGAAFDTPNMGVSALAAGTIQCVLHLFPDAEIVLLGYGRSGSTFTLQIAGQQVLIRFVNMRFSKKFHLKNNIAMLILLALALRLIPSRKLRRRVIFGNPCLKEIYQADLIASIAGGDSFSDIYGIARLLYTALPQVLVLLLSKNLVLLPQTLGPFKSKVAKVIARYILTRAERIYSRDDAGLRETEAWLGSAVSADKMQFCYDVGFVVDAIPPANLDITGLTGLPAHGRKDSPLVGLNVSGLLFMGGYRRNNMFGLRVGYEKLVQSLIAFLIEKMRARVLLVPHVLGSHGESDSAVCARIYEQFKDKYGDKLSLARGTYDQSEIKYVIGLCDFFIGSRMHACIAAVSQNIPAVSIAYSDKFIGVMKTVGVEGLVADARKIDQEEVLWIVNQAYEQRAQLRQQLERKMPEVRETVLNLFDGLSGLPRAAEIRGEFATQQSGSEIHHAASFHSE